MRCKRWVLSRCLIDRRSVRCWGPGAWGVTCRWVLLAACLTACPASAASLSREQVTFVLFPLEDIQGTALWEAPLQTWEKEWNCILSERNYLGWSLFCWIITWGWLVVILSASPSFFCKVFSWFKKEYHQPASLISFSAAFRILTSSSLNCFVE